MDDGSNERPLEPGHPFPVALPLLRSLRSQLLAAFLLPTLAVFAVAGSAGYFLSRQILEDELGRSLSSVAAAAASQVSGERMLTIDPEDDRNQTRTYRSLLRLLTDIRNSSGARRIFAVDARGRLRVDAGGNLPVGAEMPELARDRSELAQVLQGSPAASQVLFEGSDGRPYKTGYAPVFQGPRVVGVIGVEGSAEFFRPLARLLRAFVSLAVAALALLAGVAVLTARGLSRPLGRLMSSALRIGRGDLQTAVTAERTLEFGVLANELELMRRALESRDRQLKMMLAGVAHEVRNPIGGIGLFTGLLAEQLGGHRSDPSLAEARDHLVQIQKDVDHLQRVVEDFLEFAMEQRLARSPFDAGALVRSAAELVRPDAHQRDIDVRVFAAPSVVDADRSLLIAAIVNLLKNAIQASPTQGMVEIAGRMSEGMYAIEVRDHGPGIPVDAHEKIFEPFYTTREKGTGLGLPLARKIVQAHGGEIGVQSSPGLTIFRMRIPLATGASS